MRNRHAAVCLLLLALAGCNRQVEENTDTLPVSIAGTGEQLLTLRMPGMT